jgi:hypothetical protein
MLEDTSEFVWLVSSRKDMLAGNSPTYGYPCKRLERELWMKL